ncbi:peroxisomal leader peptide-processing protease [Gasterosteus aculeatus]
MEVRGIEKWCCVVQVLDAFSAENPASCSGVIVHRHTGTVICSGVPFSRFATDKRSLSSDRGFLLPHRFSDTLKIRVSFPTERDASSPSGGETSAHREVAAELLMLVSCPEFTRAFRAVFQEADKWRFHADEGDEELAGDALSLGWFAVLKASVGAAGGPDAAGAAIPWRSGSSLRKGLPVVACGSPFGSLCVDLFGGSLSAGILSNLCGEGNAVVLTDARCLPGAEGGGLFAAEAPGDARLLGLIVSPFGWKANEWIGLTLVCSVDVIFGSVARCRVGGDPLRGVWPDPGSAAPLAAPCGTRGPAVCFVESGTFWGSGVVVAPRLVVTCRHVVNGRSKVGLKFHRGDRVQDVTGDVLFATKASSSYDLALVKLRDSVAEAVVPCMTQSYNPGESVQVVGYGGLGRKCGPSLTRGVLSKTISFNDQPVMLQTTCAVQAGTSGGAVVRTRTGELLGIVSSNTRDFAANVTYPHLNFSIPVAVFQSLLQHFHQTKDVNVFRVLDSTEKEVSRVWRLQSAQSKL